MTPLEKEIWQEIHECGRMQLDRYMQLCLSHPEHGYYVTRNPIGASRDFTTAPEISQIFGEMIGLWLLQTWVDIGTPKKFVLAELGPGSGALMADILRVVEKNQEFVNAMTVCLVETSPEMRRIQTDALPNTNFAHFSTVSDLPEMPLLLVANEFFDALPVQQFVKTDIGWQERQIVIGDAGLEFGLARPKADQTLEGRHPDLANGLIVERSTLSEDIVEFIGDRIIRFGGAALIVDYGDWTGFGDTFQAVKQHCSTDTLIDPGQNDLTCHVQFHPLFDKSNCLAQFTTQGVFLENMGISDRARALCDDASNKEVEHLVSAHYRLVHPDEMGHLFKVMALRRPDTSDLIGFDNEA